MTDGPGRFAAFADLMTEMCIYYLVIGVLFLGNRGWGLPLLWLLAGAAACHFVFLALLKRTRGVPFLTLVTALLFAGIIFAFVKLSTTPVAFGYALALGLGAGMAVGLALYHCLHRPPILNHLTHLDALLLALTALLLCRIAGNVEPAAVPVTVGVLLLDAAGAVGLRMTEGDGADGGDSLRASLAAMGAAGLLTLAIAALTALFSRSGGVTGAVLSGIGRVLTTVGGAIERFVYWLASFVHLREDYAAAEIAAGASGEMGAYDAKMPEIPVNTTVILVLICLLLAAAAIAVARQLRRKKIAPAARKESTGGVRVGRRRGYLSAAAGRLRRALRFRWTAFVNRDTPGGLFLWLERRGRRLGLPRAPGETMRAYLTRLAPAGELLPLAEALDRVYYAGETAAMPPEACRALRRTERRRQRAEKEKRK